MDAGGLSATLAVLLVASLATERLVAVLKTAFPRLLAGERRTETREVDPVADRPRRLMVQGAAFAAAWLVVAVMAAGDGGPAWASFLHPVRAGEMPIPAPVAALLASGGSAFWAQVVQWAGAAKDRAVTRRAAEGLAFRQQAQSLGIALADGGRAAGRFEAQAADHRAFLLQQLRAVAPQSPVPAADRRP